jgi:hypothetical protein
MNKDLKIYLVQVVIIVIIIVSIFYIKGLFNSETFDQKTAECIASKTVLYSQTSCTHCIAQKKILGAYTSLFTIVECDKEPQKCTDANILGTPTWIINNKTVIEGTQSIEQLKNLTACANCEVNPTLNNAPSCSINNTNSSCIQPLETSSCVSGVAK